MNAANFFGGIAIVVIGAFLFFAGPQLILIPSTEIQVVGLFHDETFTVGDVWERSLQLDEGVAINGTVAVSSALTEAATEISMFVADDANYQTWVTHGNPTFTLQRSISSGQSFNFVVPRAGLYHFVFDNTDSPVKKKVTINADLQKQFVTNVPDKRVLYVAYGVLGVGCFVTVIGVLRKTQPSWT